VHAKLYVSYYIVSMVLTAYACSNKTNIVPEVTYTVWIVTSSCFYFLCSIKG